MAYLVYQEEARILDDDVVKVENIKIEMVQIIDDYSVVVNFQDVMVYEVKRIRIIVHYCKVYEVYL